MSNSSNLKPIHHTSPSVFYFLISWTQYTVIIEKNENGKWLRPHIGPDDGAYFLCVVLSPFFFCLYGNFQSARIAMATLQWDVALCERDSAVRLTLCVQWNIKENRCLPEATIPLFCHLCSIECHWGCFCLAFLINWLFIYLSNDFHDSLSQKHKSKLNYNTHNFLFADFLYFC